MLALRFCGRETGLLTISNESVTNVNVTNKEHSEGYLAGAYFERLRIWEGIEKLYETSHNSRTPIYQDTMYEKLRDIIWPVHPPRSFRDKGNGE